MANSFPTTSTTLRLISLAALLAGSISLAPEASAKELSYEEALKALNQTKQHTNKAAGWGERRTIKVPAGADPNQIIKKEVLQVPGVTGINGPTTPKSVNPIKVDAPLQQEESAPAPQKQQIKSAAPTGQSIQSNRSNQSGGWDWLSSKDSAQKQAASAPVPSTPAQSAPVPAAPAITATPATAPTAAAPVVNTSTLSAQSGAVVPVSNTGSFTPVNGSSMKTVYQAPVTSTPAKTTTSAQKADNLLDLDNGGSVKTAQANTAEESAPPVPAAPKKVDKEKAAEYYNRAVKNHLTGKLSLAIADYNAAIEANPELGQARCNLGLIYNQRHEYDKAISEFRKALAINPKDAFTYNGIGAALRAQKDYDGALKNWQTATSLKPDLATAHYNLGTVYEIKKDYDKAMVAYQDAIKNDYRLGEAYFRTGLILVRKNRLKEAKEQFKKSLEISEKAEYSETARQKIAIIEKQGV